MIEPTLQEKLDQLPARPGVYIFKDVAGDVIYVGKAASLHARVRSYFGSNSHKPQLAPHIHDLDYVVTDSETEALALEFNLIQKHRPRFNVRYRDDKSYPYIRIDLREPFPTLCVVRQHAVVPDGARYFGPYLSARDMWDTIRLVRRTFGICPKLVVSAKRRGGCTWRPEQGTRRRPCLDYHMGRCLGPCIGAVSSEEYQEAVRKVCDFLEGKQEHILQQLHKEMEQASATLRFEQAARIRDQVEAIEITLRSQRVVSTRREDFDVIGYALREDTGCMAVLQVRDGRLVGQDQHLLEGVSGVPAEEVLNEFCKLYYQKAAAAPKAVMLPLEIAEGEAISQLLSRRRGSPVRIVVPRRGQKKQLIEMAMENAQEHLRSLLESESAERRRGEEAIADLKNVLRLPTLPRRIEAYDISNVQGRTAVGSMVVFEDGHPKRDGYRRFRVRLESGPNDYEMMREVLSRRLKAAVSGNVKFQHLPDLVLVDGGAGQLGVALRAMEELGMRMPAAGLAKEHEHIYLPGSPQPVALPQNSRALHLLQRVRDEAHRFALAYHHALRARQARESVLDAIPGIGEQRKRRLLSHFGGLSGLRRASVAEIASVCRCGEQVAEAVARAVAQPS